MSLKEKLGKTGWTETWPFLISKFFIDDAKFQNGLRWIMKKVALCNTSMHIFKNAYKKH